MREPKPKSRTDEPPASPQATAAAPVGSCPSDAQATDPVALEILRGTSRMLIDAGSMPISEFTLPTGRRADIAALDRDGLLTIVEIKSNLADFRSDQKWPEYAEFCDRFYFAVKPDFPRDVLPPNCGLILADRYGAEIVRPAEAATALPAARRKALTLRFARTAAQRLAIRMDPSLAGRSEAKDI
jgi:hypothetical protein